MRGLRSELRTILVTGSDTGVGKTQVVAALARLCAERGGRVQVVKVLETGTDTLPNGEGDAARACRMAGGEAQAFTLIALPAALAPATAAAALGRLLSLEILVEKLVSLPACDVRICEGAGGIATPVDDRSRDWADFGAAIGAQAAVIVVPDRLGAINQGRLAQRRGAGRSRGGGVEPSRPAGGRSAALGGTGVRSDGTGGSRGLLGAEWRPPGRFRQSDRAASLLDRSLPG